MSNAVSGINDELRGKVPSEPIDDALTPISKTSQKLHASRSCRDLRSA
jgi:hypothetical protein